MLSLTLELDILEVNEIIARRDKGIFYDPPTTSDMSASSHKEHFVDARTNAYWRMVPSLVSRMSMSTPSYSKVPTISIGLHPKLIPNASFRFLHLAQRL